MDVCVGSAPPLSWFGVAKLLTVWLAGFSCHPRHPGFFLGALGQILDFTSRTLRVFTSWAALFLDHLPFYLSSLLCYLIDLETGSLIFSFWLRIALSLISSGAGAGLPSPSSSQRDLCPLQAILLPSDLGKAGVGMKIQKCSSLPQEPGTPPPAPRSSFLEVLSPGYSLSSWVLFPSLLFSFLFF